MKYDVDLNSEYEVTNVYDLPDDSPVGHIFSFHHPDGSVLNTVCVCNYTPNPCSSCVYLEKNGDCPYDPDAGEFMCDVYDCAFKELDKILEAL